MEKNSSQGTQGTSTKSSTEQLHQPPLNAAERRYGEITDDLIRKGTASRQRSNETDEQFFERITNLSLHSKGIRRISNLEICPKLRVLFLYSNNLWEIENLSFARNLTHLYLENNQISRIRELSGLRNLVKLCLDGNRISYLEGLEGCFSLQEIHLSNQRLGSGDSLGFDVATMDSIAESLRTLTVSNTNLIDLAPLRCLMNLQVLRAGGNQIRDLRQVEGILESCSFLQELELQGNPISQFPDYRDSIILKSELLQIIDDRPIQPNQRAFLQARESRRRRELAKRERTFALRSVHANMLAKNPEKLQPRFDSAEEDRISPEPGQNHDQYGKFAQHNYRYESYSGSPSLSLGVASSKHLSKTPTRHIPKYYRNGGNQMRSNSTGHGTGQGFSTFLNVGALSIAKPNRARSRNTTNHNPLAQHF